MIFLKNLNSELIIKKTDLIELVFENIKFNNELYVSMIDAVVLQRVIEDQQYNKLLDSFDVLICDSSLLIFLNNIKLKRKDVGFNGSDLFKELIENQKYNQLLIGGSELYYNQLVDKSLNKNLHYLDVGFHQNAKDFDYEGIESYVINNNIQILWVMLGNPKQDYVLGILKSRGNINCAVISSGAVYLFYLNIIKTKDINFIGLKFFWLSRILQNPKVQIKRVGHALLHLTKYYKLLTKK
jgi:UDP-N-acetyl-D-mannosaminuronic acid transferase (WecB/TagA/CpsF family)